MEMLARMIDAGRALNRGLLNAVFIARHDKAGVAARVEQLRRALAEMDAVAPFPKTRPVTEPVLDNFMRPVGPD
jgi:hypothetical protein